MPIINTLNREDLHWTIQPNIKIEERIMFFESNLILIIINEKE